MTRKETEPSGRAPSLRELIEQDIVTGRYMPGDRLDEVRLAERFGVSRTPVREALLQLASTGLLIHQPRRGAFVADSSPAELVEMFEVMAELEGMCGRLAARRAHPEQIEAIATAHRNCLAQGADSDAYYDENERFHQAIYEASGNGFLAREALALHRRLRPYRRLQLRVPGRIPMSAAEHERILDAIRAGDAPGADAALKAHVLIQGERFSDFFAALNGERTRALAERERNATTKPAGRRNDKLHGRDAAARKHPGE